MTHHPTHHVDEPSPWVRRFAPLIRSGGATLDVACGAGRHARLLAGMGYSVEAVDRDAEALAQLAGVTGVHTRCADLEGGAWPYAGQRFDGIIITNYLHRPLLPHLLATLGEGGVLIYETFMLGNERFGRPGNPDFLLRSNELLDIVHDKFVVIAFEQGEVALPKQAVVQRICAVRVADADATLIRLPAQLSK